MSKAHESPNYMMIFYWLAGLTAVEIAVAYLPASMRVLMIALLIGLAVAKAALVAMYFMHLRFEKRTLSVIALTPPVLLILFVVITYPDIAWRLFSWARPMM
jgi:cytochrome c oxidase subunit IV